MTALAATRASPIPGCEVAGSYGSYLRRAAEASLERCGVERFDLLLLHNPDRIGYTSPEVWDAMAALRDEGLADSIGVAPGPANGFTLDVIACLERFGPLIDWAMLILNPFEPWPARLALPACVEHDVRVLARVVDYGGLFHDALFDESVLVRPDHRLFRPAGWVAAGRERLDLVRPIADRHGLTLLQLACQWTLAQPAVACVVPTLIQEPGPDAKPVELEREELASLPAQALTRRRARRDRAGRRQHREHVAEGRLARRTRATSGPTRGRSTTPCARSRGVSGSCRSAIS